ncbi:MAG: ATP synthase subunit I [Spirulina sp.]
MGIPSSNGFTIEGIDAIRDRDMTLDLLALTLAFVAGLGLGLLYFGGLWLTVRQLPASEHPFLLFSVSLLLRLAIALGGFYLIIARFVGGKLIIVLLTCIFGFLITRNIFIYLTTTFSEVKTDSTSRRE